MDRKKHYPPEGRERAVRIYFWPQIPRPTKPNPENFNIPGSEAGRGTIDPSMRIR